MTTSKTILLVEDDTTLNFIIRDNLEEAGYEVVAAEDGMAGLKAFEKQHFDLCLFDVMLPKMDGFSLAQEVRKLSLQVPILFLTAKNLNDDKIAGFNCGGDDYITKPFSMEELLLRIQVFLRRSNYPVEEMPTKEPSSKWQIGRFSFAFDDLLLSIDKKERTLTFKEGELLLYFCRNANSIMTRSDILSTVWGADDYYMGRSLDVFISRLRKYLRPDENIKIINLHGVGFRFNAEVKNL
ncbi:MAG: response regulator transcription factor [Mangrovibacterium sp.]